MTTALYVAMGWLAIIALAIRVYSLRGIVKLLAELQEQTHRTLASVSGEKDSLAEELADVISRRNQLEWDMDRIATLIGRRPPRRNWLARSRKVALLANGVSDGHDELRSRGIKIVAAS